MDDIMGNVNQQLANSGIEAGVQNLQNAASQSTVALIVAIAVGLILCFFGLKLFRALASIGGFFAGCLIGLSVAVGAGLEGVAFAGVIVGCGVVLAVLSGIFYKVGIFIWAFGTGIGIAAAILAPENALMFGICAVIGLVVAIFAVVFVKPLIIILSSLSGGASAGMAIAALAGLDQNVILSAVAAFGLAALGMIVQFMMRSKEIGKREKVYAKEYREKASMETEVEKARMFLGDDDLDSGEDN